MAYPFEDPDLPLSQRIDDLLGRLTLDEKASQMNNASPAIERLGIPAFDWWSEGLHGVGRAGRATVFPQAIGLAATWSPDLVYRVAEAISSEARAKHHAAVRMDNPSINLGLSIWSPTINILRDPRWGRSQETYGEDPYLTSRLAVAFVRGLQGEDPKYLKTVATPKHFAAHSGPEAGRTGFDVAVSAKDLFETFLPAFEASVREGGAQSIMGAYTALNGKPCCANDWLLGDLLRDQWGFDGYVVSDCGAIEALMSGHHYAEGLEEAAAKGVQAGCDLCCGQAYALLPRAVEKGLVDEADVDRSLRRLLATRFRLGMFDPLERVPYATIPESVVECDAHRELAREAAHKSIVLLQNDGTLPLSRELKSVLVTGPTAEALDVLWGNYNGYASRMVTLLEGFTGAVSPGTRLNYAMGCPLSGPAGARYAQAAWYAGMCDVFIACLGLTPRLEGEEGEELFGEDGDRVTPELPAAQAAYLAWLMEFGKPVVLVLTGGSPIALPPCAAKCSAILWVGYPGQEGGHAVADVVFGAVSPSGRLPMTVPKPDAPLPPMTSYAMAGRTYRYADPEHASYPFGFGLSYSEVEYSEPKVFRAAATVTVTNAGAMDTDEVVQVYGRVPGGPRLSLVGFRRIALASGETRRVEVPIGLDAFTRVEEDGSRSSVHEGCEAYVGPGQPGPDAVWIRVP